MMKRLLFISYFCISAIISFGQSAPIFYYPFNGNTTDASGNGNVCTNFGATLTTDRFGNENSAYYFDGTDDYMQIDPVSSELGNMSDFTLSLWIKKDGWQVAGTVNTPNRQMLFCGHSSNNKAQTNEEIYKPGLSLMIDYNDVTKEKSYYEIIMQSYVPVLYNYKSVTFDIQQKWTHVVYSRQNTTTYLFSDGILISKAENMNSAIGDMLHELYIGTFAGNNSYYYFKDYNFQGSIDDVILSNNPYLPISVTSYVKKASNPLFKDGEIALAISGGVEPYTINWDNGMTGKDITGLAEGEYNFTITDSLGQIFTNKISVEANLNITVTCIQQNESFPNQKDGAIKLTITGGTAPYTAVWDNGMTGNNISGLSKGDYNVTITDSKGLSYKNTFTIDVNTIIPITVSYQLKNESLPNQKDGVIKLTISGGMAPYTVVWDNGQTGTELNGLSKGTYIAEITDALGSSTQIYVELKNNYPDPIAFYPFNNNTNDETGHGNTCINVNAELTNDRLGNQNSAYYFDGMNSFLEITPKSEEFKAMTDFTISLWYKKEGWQGNRNNPTNRQYLFCGHSGSKTELTNDLIYQKGFSLAIDYDEETKKQQYYEYLLESYNPLVYKDQTIPQSIPQIWNFLVFKREGSLTSLYENGELIASKSNMNANITDMFHSLYIGTFNGNNPSYYYSEYNFRGTIDEVCIWNKALSENQITYLLSQNNKQSTIKTDTFAIKGQIDCPEGTVCRGTVIAFNVDDKTFHPLKYDIVQNKKYIIPGLIKGLYIVYCIPDEPIKNECVPTYFPNSTYWQDAYTINLIGNAYNVNITMSGTEASKTNGLGTISGTIIAPDDITLSHSYYLIQNDENQKKVQNMPVLLLQNNKIIDWTISDDNGYYEFPMLGYGEYEVMVEYQNVATIKKTITLSKDLTDSNDNDFNLNEIQTTIRTCDAEQTYLYPNTTTDKASIVCPDFISYSITNLQGVRVIQPTANKTIDVSQLPAGIYYVTIASTKDIKTHKLIKR